MIATYRKKETFEALRWDGEDKDELEEFVGLENLEWKLYTNHPSIPCIKNSNSDIIEVDVLPYFIVKESDEKFTVYGKQDFDNLFERI